MQKYLGAAMLTAAVMTAGGCGDTIGGATSKPSLVSTQLDGLYTGPMTLAGVAGGECAGAVAPALFGGGDQATIGFVQDGNEFTGRITTDSSRLSCTLAGTPTQGGLAAESTSCNGPDLVVFCADGSSRQLHPTSTSLDAASGGSTLTGSIRTLYSVMDADKAVGTLGVEYSFSATRR